MPRRTSNCFVTLAPNFGRSPWILILYNGPSDDWFWVRVYWQDLGGKLKERAWAAALIEMSSIWMVCASPPPKRNEGSGKSSIAVLGTRIRRRTKPALAVPFQLPILVVSMILRGRVFEGVWIRKNIFRLAFLLDVRRLRFFDLSKN